MVREPVPTELVAIISNENCSLSPSDTALIIVSLGWLTSVSSKVKYSAMVSTSSDSIVNVID